MRGIQQRAMKRELHPFGKLLTVAAAATFRVEIFFIITLAAVIGFP